MQRNWVEMNQSFVHVNLPTCTNDAIQRLLARAIEWREEQDLIEASGVGASVFAPSGKEEHLPAEALGHLGEKDTRRGNGLVVVAAEPDAEFSISYSQSSTEP